MVSLMDPTKNCHFSIFLLISSFFLVPVYSKDVKAVLNTNWKQTPILAEISEFLAAESDQKYYSFVDWIVEDSAVDCEKWSDKQKYEHGLKHASKLLGDEQMHFLKLSLSIRKMSPLVETHQKLAADARNPNLNCSAFFVYNKQAGCDLSRIVLTNSDATKNSQKLFDFDHVFPDRKPKNFDFFIIYGELGTIELRKMLEEAWKIVHSDEKMRFVIRHHYQNEHAKFISLSGYGVELAIKNTEYKAHDSRANMTEFDQPEMLHGFNFKTLLAKYKPLENKLESLRDHLSALDEIVPLKKWQLNDLSNQICQSFLTNSLEDPVKALDELKEVSENFPVYASKVSRIKVDDKFKKNAKKMSTMLKQHEIKPGSNILLLNGRKIETDGTAQIDLFNLVDAVREESKLAGRMSKIGLTNQKSYIPILSVLDLSRNMPGVALDYRTAYPNFINNLEDHEGMPRSLRYMLQPYPGQIRPIARNIFTLILIVNPFEDFAHEELLRFTMKIISEKIFIRIGWIFTYNDAEETGQSASQFMELLTRNMTVKAKYFINEEVKEPMERGNDFLKTSGLYKSTQVLLNGYVINLGDSEKSLEEKVMEQVEIQTTMIQKAILYGTISDHQDIADWWLTGNSDVVQRAHYKTLEAFHSGEFLNLVDIDRFVWWKTDKNFIFSNVSNELKKLKYSNQKESAYADVTTWVVTDLESRHGRRMAYDALKPVAAEKTNRVAIIPNPTDIEPTCLSLSATSFFVSMIESEPSNKWITILEKVVFTADMWNPKSKVVVEIFESFKKSSVCDSLKDQKDYLLRGLFSIDEGKSVVISNGLVIGPLDNDELFNSNDFSLIDKTWEQKKFGNIAGLLQNSQLKTDEVDDLMGIKLYSEGIKIDVKERFYVSGDGLENSVRIPARNPEIPSISVTWIANPASHDAQKIVSVVQLLSEVANADIEILLNPAESVSDMPVKRFYRFVVKKELEFDENGDIVESSALFKDMPRKQLLTMSIHTNDAWMIEAKEAKYDMDNILLDSVPNNEDVVASFSLEYILVEGQCLDGASQPAKGIQIELKSGNMVFDTIVMYNLGYFQLKARPGVWSMGLRLGDSLFNHRILKLDNKYVADDPDIVIDSFSSKWRNVRVVELSEIEKLFISKLTSVTGIFDTVKSFFDEEEQVINVFSLASGHLYERFLRIMMLSVLKNTDGSKVKFWLLKNYLSPKFKKTIPKLAEKYKFDYELVEYKWPKWLHRQNEKQRIMWGYKILFLDVLFPLNVDKIIFVDADQVVRADLQELMDFPLNEAPYGYVPFCDSRREMDGFRFWKNGYWNDHLNGRKYHISALYVVDLKQFRKIWAGDRLRGRYAALSTDPNSLSNLDQDLPNNMIHEVPIKSLPQDWLWCETWCDDKSKKRAKTIDLCNNPMTKEPKMSSAVRIIDEWKDYDREIEELLKKIDEEELKSNNHDEL